MALQLFIGPDNQISLPDEFANKNGTNGQEAYGRSCVVFGSSSNNIHVVLGI
jgi:hypothetical protein